jgi:hypothetical protein
MLTFPSGIWRAALRWLGRGKAARPHEGTALASSGAAGPRKRRRIRRAPLRPTILLLTDVTGHPVRPSSNGGRPSVGGLADRKGRMIAGSGYARRGTEQVATPGTPAPADAPVIEQECLFGGYFKSHYGHFLLESVARLWATRAYPDLPIIWLRQRPMTSYHREILDILGVRNPHLFIERPTVFRRLRMPTVGFELADVLAARHCRFLGAYRPTGPRSSEKVWVSRSRLDPKLSKIDQEPEIEEHLTAAGWRIFHPQEHSVRAQLEVLGTAAELAGFMGSAFHTLLLLETVPAPVTMFGRPQARFQQFELVARVKGLDQRIIVAGEKTGDDKRFRDINVDVALVCDTLGVSRRR